MIEKDACPATNEHSVKFSVFVVVNEQSFKGGHVREMLDYSSNNFQM